MLSRVGRRRFGNAVLLPFVLLAPLVTATRAQEPEMRKYLDESRAIALKAVQEYRAQLAGELKISGPLRALMVCRYSCPEMISKLSRKTGWGVGLVSLKPRDPATGMPDVWEQRVLLDFERRVAKGERGDGLEFAEVVAEPQGRYYRYARAIIVEPVCLACHGPVDSLSDSVKAQLSLHYPFDQATGYRVGQLYGIATVKRPY